MGIDINAVLLGRTTAANFPKSDADLSCSWLSNWSDFWSKLSVTFFKLLATKQRFDTLDCSLYQQNWSFFFVRNNFDFFAQTFRIKWNLNLHYEWTARWTWQCAGTCSIGRCRRRRAPRPTSRALPPSRTCLYPSKNWIKFQVLLNFGTF